MAALPAKSLIHGLAFDRSPKDLLFFCFLFLFTKVSICGIFASDGVLFSRLLRLGCCMLNVIPLLGFGSLDVVRLRSSVDSPFHAVVHFSWRDWVWSWSSIIGVEMVTLLCYLFFWLRASLGELPFSNSHELNFSNFFWASRICTTGHTEKKKTRHRGLD